MRGQVTLTDKNGKQSTYKATLRGFDPDKVRERRLLVVALIVLSTACDCRGCCLLSG